jgi:hypothetical protein
MAAIIAYGLYGVAGVLVAVIAPRYRGALLPVVQAWLRRFGHPGFVILAPMIARGAWATGKGLHAAAAASPDRRRHGLPRHLRAPPGERGRSHWKSCR